MKETPILFSHAMAQAAYDEVKTETRRIVKGEVPEWADRADFNDVSGWGFWSWMKEDGPRLPLPAVSYRVGQILWVREPYFQRGHWAPLEGQKTKGGRQKYGFVPADDQILFHSRDIPAFIASKDFSVIQWHVRLARFMPRKYSRLRLQVVGVSVERLHDIQEDAILREGVTFSVIQPPMDDWRQLWERINGPESWDANPFVWVVKFQKLK